MWWLVFYRDCGVFFEFVLLVDIGRRVLVLMVIVMLKIMVVVFLKMLSMVSMVVMAVLVRICMVFGLF